MARSIYLFSPKPFELERQSQYRMDTLLQKIEVISHSALGTITTKEG